MNNNYYPIVFDLEGTGFSVTNAGTAPAPCVLTIVPRVNLLNITIEGLSKDPIIITNVAANDTVVLDGENNTFTINGTNAWDKFGGWQFPRLEPGINNITISNGQQMDVEIAYNVRYI